MKEGTTLTKPAIAPDPLKETASGGQRVTTIDILRALTMVLMIFVNDLWSLSDIPGWLGHVDAGVDGIGLSDVVFPAFLFIVGLSIPYALDNRRKKGDSDGQLLQHVLWRTIALLVMGVFLVNGETINEMATGIPRYAWGPVCCLCFILIWNNYPANSKRAVTYSLRALAAIILLYLAFIYRGGADDALRRFGPQWWGILGMIGWAYLIGATIAVFARNRFQVILLAWLLLSALSILHHAQLLPEFLYPLPSVLRDGTHAGLTVGGILTALIFRYYREKNDNRTLTFVLLVFAALLFILSTITRPYWGLSKLSATPAWLFLCSAFTILAFLVIYWVADVQRKSHWFDIIKPAGTATLLCYLIPHFVYFTIRVLGISLPHVMLTGATGLLKSFFLAMLCVFITGGLIKAGVRMKI